jgi:hypothetical protein
MKDLFGFLKKYGVWFPGLTALLIVFTDAFARAHPAWIGRPQPSLVAETVGGLLLLYATFVLLLRWTSKWHEKKIGEADATSLVVFWACATVVVVPILRTLHGMGVGKAGLLTTICIVAAIAMAWSFESHLRDFRKLKTVGNLQRHWLLSKPLLPIAVGCYFYFSTVGNIAYSWTGFILLLIAYLILGGLVENKNSFDIKVSTG